MGYLKIQTQITIFWFFPIINLHKVIVKNVEISMKLQEGQ
jgi:hypothetical protein